MNQNLVYNMRTILRAKNDFTVYKDTTRRTKNQFTIHKDAIKNYLFYNLQSYNINNPKIVLQLAKILYKRTKNYYTVYKITTQKSKVLFQNLQNYNAKNPKLFYKIDRHI